MQRRSIVALRAVAIFLLVSSCAQAQVELIQLKSKEGTIFTVPKDAAFLSRLIMELSGDFSDRVITLDRMNDVTLSSVVKYLNMALREYKKEIPGFNPKVEEERAEWQKKVIEELSKSIHDELHDEGYVDQFITYLKSFITADEPVGKITSLIRAADYLAFPELIEAASNEASKLVSWENINNKEWKLSIQMENRVAYWIAKRNRDAFFPLKISEISILQSPTQTFNTMAFSPDNTKIVTTATEQVARIWNTKTGQLIHLLEGHTGQVNTAKFSPDGTKIVTGSEDRTTRIWNAATGQLIRQLGGHEDQVISAEFSLNGTKIVTGSFDATVRLWNADSGESIYVLITDHDLDEGIEVEAQFNADGTKIGAFSDEGEAWVWDAETGVRINAFNEGADWVQFNQNINKIITGSHEMAARIWNAANSTLIYTLTGHTDWVTTGQFSPDNTKIVTASQDASAKIWNAETGQLIHSLVGHTHFINSAQFSPDSRMLITSSNDGTAKIWNAQTGLLTYNLEMTTTISRDTSAQFSIDGTNIATASEGGTAKIWDLSQPWILHYERADRFTSEQALLIVTLKENYKEGKPTIFTKMTGYQVPPDRLKHIFKTFIAPIRKSLTKRFNIQEEPPEEIFEEGLEQLGL